MKPLLMFLPLRFAAYEGRERGRGRAIFVALNNSKQSIYDYLNHIIVAQCSPPSFSFVARTAQRIRLGLCPRFCTDNRGLWVGVPRRGGQYPSARCFRAFITAESPNELEEARYKLAADPAWRFVLCSMSATSRSTSWSARCVNASECWCRARKEQGA